MPTTDDRDRAEEQHNKAKRERASIIEVILAVAIIAGCIILALVFFKVF